MPQTRFEIQSQLRDDFGSDVDEQDVLEECTQICVAFDITPEDLLYKWHAFSYSAKAKDRVILPLTIDGARELHSRIRQEAAVKAERVATTPASKFRNPTARRFGSANKFSSSPLATPRPAARTEISASKLSTESVVHRPRIRYTPPSNLIDFDYRYMYERLAERADALDEVIDDMADLVKSHYGLDELGDPSSMTDGPTVVVGRMCTDSEDSKPNESSFLIESSQMLGSGKRVALSFAPTCTLHTEISGRRSYNFFSGQIVALKGRNGDGLRYIVSDILALPRIVPRALSEREAQMDEEHPVVFSACGPYSSDQDLDYTPFSKLIEHVQRHRPSALILLGPFVDINNQLIKTGDIKQSPLAYFQEYIISKLESLISSVPGISIYLAPSPRDVIHNHIAFPQKQLASERFGLSPHITVIPNPCVFGLNGIDIGITNIDVLGHMFPAQYTKPVQTVPTDTAKPLDGVQLMALQLLEQRSFYPIFPVPSKESSNVNLDVSHSHLLRFPNAAPDVLIVPSKLKSGYRIVDRTVVINSGFATRVTNADAYARIVLPALNSVSATGTDTDIPERMKVEIVKLDAV